MRVRPHSIFNVTPQKISTTPERESSFSAEDWFEAIKTQARKNLDNFWERARIEWTARFKIPKYDKFEKYSREEVLCELWEQFYLENPDHLDMKGIYKKTDPDTGLSYYVTGDPVIDKMERDFAKGIVPDMNAAFKDTIKERPKRIWEEPVFQADDGVMVSAEGRFDGMKSTSDGKYVTKAGTTVRKTDFTNDDWLDDALKEDPVLKAMKEKMGV